MRSLRVSVPAQLLNLGPAVGSRAIALDLRDQFLIEPVASSQIAVSVIGREKNSQPTDERNLVVTALHATQDSLGLPRFGLRISIDSFIPRQRGLGSSVASVAAGVAAALAFSGHAPQLGTPEFTHELFDLTARLLSRPLGAAAAVYGSLTSIWHTDRTTDVPVSVVKDSQDVAMRRAFEETCDFGWHAESMPIDPSISAYVFFSRQTRDPSLTPIPSAVPDHRDPALEMLRLEAGASADVPADRLVSSLTRASLLAAALCDPATRSTNQRLYEATQGDIVLERLRTLLPDAVQLCEHLRSLGYAAFIAGKGPTVVVLRSGTDDVPLTAGRLRGATANQWLTGRRWMMEHVPLAHEGIEVDPLD